MRPLHANHAHVTRLLSGTDDLLPEQWTDSVFHALETNGLDVHVDRVATRNTPSTLVEVVASSYAAAYSIANLLAGTSPVGERVEDAATHRVHTIVVLGWPVIVTWTDDLARGARPARLDSEPRPISTIQAA